MFSGCTGVGNWEKQGTWFPGFLWRVCVCPKCRTHVGWMFEPEDLVTDGQLKPSQVLLLTREREGGGHWAVVLITLVPKVL